MAMSFFHAFQLPLTIARPFNTYGPRQSARAVIPTIISQIAAGKKEIDLGDTSPTRDFNYVDDTCSGFIALAREEKSVGEIINIGSDQEISIGDLFEMINHLMKSDTKINRQKERLRPEGSEVFRLKCDNTKIKSLTAYQPAFSLEEGLKKTIDWFTNPGNLKKYKTDIYNV